MLDNPEWYRCNFVELRNEDKFCADYWAIANRYSTYQQALNGRKMRWVLYTVYVVQRERKARWVEMEPVIREYGFPRKLYCEYLYLLNKKGRLSDCDFSHALSNMGETLGSLGKSEELHWTEQFEQELLNLEREG